MNNTSELQDSVQITENIRNIGDKNIAEVMDEWLEGKFVSPNVINLSTRNLCKAKISLLSKGLKFIATPTTLNKTLIKEKLECFG